VYGNINKLGADVKYKSTNTAPKKQKHVNNYNKKARGRNKKSQ